MGQVLETLGRRKNQRRPQLTDNVHVQRMTSSAWALLVIASLIVIIVPPVYYIFGSSFEDGGAGLRQMLASRAFWPVFGATLELTIGSVVLATILGVAFAWFAHALPSRRRWLGVIPLIPLAMPPAALVSGFAYMFSPTAGFANSALRWILPVSVNNGPIDIYTLPWMILVSGLMYSSFVYLFVRTSLAQLPQDLLDASAASGAGEARTFTSVVFPLIKPAVIYGALTVALMSLGQFTVPLLLGRQVGIDVLTTRMYFELGQYPQNLALASAYGIPILAAGVVFILLQRIALRNANQFVMSTGGRAGRPARHSGAFAQWTLLVYGILIIVLPVGAIILVSLQPHWSRDIKLDELSLQHYRSVLLENSLLQEAILNSTLYALLTVATVLPLAYVTARQIAKQGKLRSSVLDILVTIPLGVPAAIFGIGFFLLFVRGPLPLFGTTVGMVLIYTVLQLPFAVRVILTAMINMGPEYENAAQVSGAGTVSRTWSILVPLLRPALGGGAALVLILTSHEFTASILVRARDTDTMGSALYQMWHRGLYAESAVMAVVMCIVTVIGIALATIAGGQGSLKALERS